MHTDNACMRKCILHSCLLITNHQCHFLLLFFSWLLSHNTCLFLHLRPFRWLHSVRELILLDHFVSSEQMPITHTRLWIHVYLRFGFVFNGISLHLKHNTHRNIECVAKNIVISASKCLYFQMEIIINLIGPECFIFIQVNDFYKETIKKIILKMLRYFIMIL